MKKVVIVSCFNFWNERIKFMKNSFLKMNCEVTVLLSDFNHVKKETEKNVDDITVKYIKTKKYKRNLSVQRIISHYKFTKEIIKEVSVIKPDIIYALIPPNLIGSAFKTYRKKHNIELIFDIIDLWPESFPYQSSILKPAFGIWKNMRNKAITLADTVVTECNLYKLCLKEQFSEQQIHVLYLSGGELKKRNGGLYQNKIYRLAYIGQINHLIDIEAIEKVLQSMRKYRPVELHIIGNGKNREKFVKRMINVCEHVIEYGEVYDDKEISSILQKCDFGLNVMKNTVRVGLTMKSMNYFSNGLPIINNIPLDTWEFVDTEKVGINFNSENMLEFEDGLGNYRFYENIPVFYEKNFSDIAIQHKSDEIIRKITVKH